MTAMQTRDDQPSEQHTALERAEPGQRSVAPKPRLGALPGLIGRVLLRRTNDREEREPRALGRLVRTFAGAPMLASYMTLVLGPAAVATFYFIFIASDQYIAEARFAVRAADDTSPKAEEVAKMLPSMGPGGSTSFAQQDAEIVASYIRSRAIIDDLHDVIDIGAIFRREEADFWARLPDNASPEIMRDYWIKMVTPYIERTSGIVTVKVRAFRRDDALALARAVLDASERLVNAISLRARSDAMRRAEEEVRRADGQMRLALADLARFRDSEGVIDPVKSAELTGQLLLQLMQDKIKIETELFIAKRTTSGDAPGVSSLRARLDSVDGQIARTRAELAGNNPQAHNLAAALVRFEELEVKLQFAEGMYTFARNGLDRARVAAEKQTVYVTVFVPPSLPQDSGYPHRFTYSVLLAIGLTLAWAIVAMIWASVLDHRL